MRTLSTIVTVATLVSAQAWADDISACARLDADLDRLACYDLASGRTPSVTTEKALESDWLVSTEVSKLTDDTNVTLRLTSDERVSCRFGSDQKVSLIVRCMENTTSLIFSTSCHMTSSEYNTYGDVDIRIDDNPMTTIGFEASTNNRALGLWRGGDSIPIIKRLFGASTLIARMTPFSESPFTASFNVSGLEEAIVPLRESCGW